MKLPEYVTLEEVKRICKELNIRDWTTLKKPEVLPEEARTILAELNIGEMATSIEDFRRGLEVELEHGISDQEANVTNNHPILTGRIVLAHLKESLDYYKRLEVAEVEGDLLKALVNRDASKVEALYRKLIIAKLTLSQADSDQL
ncbi:MAG: hypothetical protein NWE78_01910 [Candidatus Bathyarchaeota archaeon]|nr:hypothetical protein [Candidatus Bathyarchaeota archaeon]